MNNYFKFNDLKKYLKNKWKKTLIENLKNILCMGVEPMTLALLAPRSDQLS